MDSSELYVDQEVKGAITLTETLRPLRHFANLSYFDITSAQSLLIMR